MTAGRSCCTCGKTRLELDTQGITLWSEPSNLRDICDDCKEIEIEAQIAAYQETEPDTDYTNNITCPHCGYEDQDSWEHGDSDDEMNCGHCGREFAMQRHIETTYSTRKP